MKWTKEETLEGLEDVLVNSLGQVDVKNVKLGN
jgi:hypothetical protein